MTEYLDILNEAWGQHLAPRTENAPTVVSLFAGCGGSNLGYSMAGYRELLAVEWDNNAVETFKLNFPEVPVYHGDICKLSVDECLKLASLQPGQLDVLDGSPPCQGFSTAGKRQLEDPRNSLFQEFVRLLRGLQPKAFVMENVSGMVKGKMKLVFAEAMRELKASGYKVSARLMNAMYFNVPQSRERMIFIGVREDLGIGPSHPKAANQPFTVKNAMAGLKYQTEDLTIPIAWANNPNWAVSQYIPRIKPGQRCDDVHPTKAGYNLIRLNWGKPSPTIPKTCNGSLYAGLLPPEGNRYCTIGELKRIDSCPDEFQIVGLFEEQWARIGNSVPPLFMRAIAGHVKTLIEPTEGAKHA